MKISISLADDDIAFLDQYARDLKTGSRSAVIHRAIRLLRAARLGPAYAQAWEEWTGAGESAEWETVVGDGLEPSR